MIIFYLGIFIFGTIIGSFLNVVIIRLAAGRSFISGRSCCQQCGRVLGWGDLLPLISFAFLGGRCRYCREKISWQYFGVELATGLGFVLIVWWRLLEQSMPLSEVISLWPVFLRDGLLFSFLIIIFVYDLRWEMILDKVAIPAIVIITALNLLLLGYSVSNVLLAGAVGGLFFWLQYVVSRGRWIGDGDIRMGVLMGVALGWPNVIIALALAYIVGAVIAIALVVSGQKKMSATIPFGTFLATATFVAALYGNQLSTWYWHLILG